MFDRDIRIIVENIISSVKAYESKNALNYMQQLVDLVGEETAETIFNKIETMLQGE